MICSECGIHFHEDHGCGTAVLVGSSYAAHCIECPLFWTGIAIPNDLANLTVSMHGQKDGYRPWEAPAGKCPVCYHGSFNPAAMGAVRKCKLGKG